MSRSDRSIMLFQAEDLERAARISPHVQIRSVRLLACACRHDPHATTGRQARVDLHVDAEAVLDRKARVLAAVASFSCRATDAQAENAEPFVVIEAKYLLEYALERVRGLTHNDAQAFARTNAIYNVWPYCREFVQGMLQRMELPPLTMPVLRPDARGAAQSRAGRARSRRKTASR